MERISFEDQITKNKIKSFFLILVIVAFFVILGYIISAFLDPSYFFVIMTLSIIFSIGYVIFSYYNSDKIAISSVKAKPANPAMHRMFFMAAENMSIASGLPMPRLYVMNSQEINGFASGRDPKHAVICMTSGALEKLSKQELEGVIAHEMSHIANYDIRFMTLTAVLIGMVSIISEMFLRSLWIRNDDRDSKAGLVLMVIGIIFAILAPIATQLVQMAISRKREYLADATGAKLTRYPQGLANALKKIKNEHVTNEEKRRFNHALAPLFISDPFKRQLSGLFATHPPIEDRIRKLEAM